MRTRIRMRSLFSRPIKWSLALMGREIVSRNRYGYDAFLDIARLSQIWQYRIDTFFDVGANVGATVRHARSRFPDCRIIAFEPHPQTFSKLAEVAEATKNVQPVNLALGSDIGFKTMFEYEMSVINSLLPNAQFAVRFNKEAQQIQVQTTTVDRFCFEHGIEQIDVLKIDTEGFDFEVVKGASSMLARHAIKFVYFEFNDISSRTDSSGGALMPIDQLL